MTSPKQKTIDTILQKLQMRYGDASIDFKRYRRKLDRLRLTELQKELADLDKETKDEYPGVAKAFERDFGQPPPLLQRKDGKTAIDDLQQMRVLSLDEDPIEVGQIWKGNARVGFAIVDIIAVGTQPKHRKITVRQIEGFVNKGYVYKEMESVFRRDFHLHMKARKV